VFQSFFSLADLFAKPYPGESTKVTFRLGTLIKFNAFVFPGALAILLIFALRIVLIIVDLPTLLLPIIHINLLFTNYYNLYLNQIILRYHY